MVVAIEPTLTSQAFIEQLEVQHQAHRALNQLALHRIDVPSEVANEFSTARSQKSSFAAPPVYSRKGTIV